MVKKRVELRKESNIITLANLVFGLLSVFFSIKGSFTVAAILLLIAVAMDYFDGKIARATKSSSRFGLELDSLADVISFGIAPVVFGYMHIGTWVAVIAYIIFLCCGVIRLAMFNVQEAKGYYKGMPITINGLIFPIIFFLGVPSLYWPYLFLASAILMIAPFRIKKI